MEKFFVHLPYSKERQYGCKAWGVEDQFVVPFPAQSEDWKKAQEWLHQQKGKSIFTIISYEAGFCHLGVELKNNPQQPALLFIVPEKWEWTNETESVETKASMAHLSFEAKESEITYQQKLSSIQQDLQQGNYYETNYCTQLEAEVETLDAYAHWQALYQANPAPFAAYLEWNEHHLLCLSPERFLVKKDNHLMSQPIKGTIKRGKTGEEDFALQHQLLTSKKDQTENTMIVDLVRNDLSKIATKGSVRVTEKCQLYTFPKLHHLISSVTCDITSETNFTAILQALFPMGSMTGVPKKKAVETMQQLEPAPRGWYSGTLGIIQPNGDFDLNVIIRSIYWNQQTQVANIGIGGAITLQSQFKDEYQECWLKAQSLINP
jgi:para-aminobenzoate synthetase component 1